MSRSIVMLAASVVFGALALPSVAETLSAKDGGPRRWEVIADGTVFRAEASEHSAGEALDRGDVLDNLGCEEEEGTEWCRVRPFRGGAAGYVAAGDLTAVEGPDGTVATGPDDSKRRAGKRDFDASAEIACAQEVGEALGTCEAEVAQSGGGDATVVVTFPNGFARQLYFRHGEFVSASATMSGAGRDPDWRLDEGRYLIRVDDQRYEVPLDFILGTGG